MALLELCEDAAFDCSRLVACLDRTTEPEGLESLTKDLGWAGFENTTLARWVEDPHGDDIVSTRWLLLDVEV